MGNVKYKIKAVLTSGYVVIGEYSIYNISIVFLCLRLDDILDIWSKQYSVWWAKFGEISWSYFFCSISVALFYSSLLFSTINKIDYMSKKFKTFRNFEISILFH